MSDTIHEGAELVVGTYAGPELEDGRGRRRWQFTCRDASGVAVLRDDELEVLLAALVRKHGDRARLAAILRAPVAP